jgi:hypothetical protein
MPWILSKHTFALDPVQATYVGLARTVYLRRVLNEIPAKKFVFIVQIWFWQTLDGCLACTH